MPSKDLPYWKKWNYRIASRYINTQSAIILTLSCSLYQRYKIQTRTRIHNIGIKYSIDIVERDTNLLAYTVLVHTRQVHLIKKATLLLAQNDNNKNVAVHKHWYW